MKPTLSSVTVTNMNGTYVATASAEIPDHPWMGCYQSTSVMFNGAAHEEDPALHLLVAAEFLTEHWFQLRWDTSHSMDCLLRRDPR